MLVATSTFLQAVFAGMIVIPVLLLWGAAIVYIIMDGGGGWRVAGLLLLVLILPIIGPLLFFGFRRPRGESVSPEAMHLAQADQRREAAARPVGGTGVHM